MFPGNVDVCAVTLIDGVVRRIVLSVLLVVDPRRELALLHRLVHVHVLPFPRQHRRLGDLR